MEPIIVVTLKYISFLTEPIIVVTLKYTGFLTEPNIVFDSQMYRPPHKTEYCNNTQVYKLSHKYCSNIKV